jgi:glycine cleavage system H protein
VFPGVDGFAWDAGHIIFLGVFYAVVAVVVATVGRAALRACADVRSDRVEKLRWHAAFEELPAGFRRCRHELAGEVARRTCENCFDCRNCAVHEEFVAKRPVPDPVAPRHGEQTVAGFELPADRLYHRGHTWVRQEPDGTLLVGLDDLGAHLLGTPSELELPPVGARLVANGTAWRARKNGVRVRVLAPVDGEVVGVGGPGLGWYLRIRPDGGGADVRHLLSAAEAGPWLLREVERLQIALADEAVGAALADGGMPVDDLSKALSPRELDEVCGMVFLEP